MKDYNYIKQFFKQADNKIYIVMETLDFSKWLEEREVNKQHEDYFVALCREIISQQLSGKAANAIIKRFEDLFDGGVNPDAILKLEAQQLRDIGMSWAKTKYVQDLAKKVKDNVIDLMSLEQFDDDAVVEELTKVKGVGPWTAEMFLIFHLHREDVFSFGDLGLKKGFTKVYGVENPTQQNIETVIKNWKPYRSYGSIALWHSLDNR
ncbi:DNA-3-methyladenine glycosylase 2 family protein [Candidatus Woesebacteria bacterium]|nr:DNA-3-methyladenine glycosylase 2 family protein [Candidatus Woesebacteria bacterium]